MLQLLKRSPPIIQNLVYGQALLILALAGVLLHLSGYLDGQQYSYQSLQPAQEGATQKDFLNAIRYKASEGFNKDLQRHCKPSGYQVNGIAEPQTMKQVHDLVDNLEPRNIQEVTPIPSSCPGFPNGLPYTTLYARSGDKNKIRDQFMIQFFIEDEHYGPFRETFPVPPRTMLELGGSAGVSASYFATIWPDTSIAVLEPVSYNFQVLSLNTAAHKNIVPFRAAAWPTNKVLNFESGQKSTATTMNNVDDVSLSSFHIDSAVRGLSVPHVMELMKWDVIDLIKIDIEGGEYELFAAEGLDQWMPKVSCLCIEFHKGQENPGKGKTSQAVIAMIKKHGLKYRSQVYDLQLYCRDI